ncbi:FAD-binding oxidoreductase [Lentibacillus populi]|uniref:FAD-binding oxidoreductase n=1 Tax=Lentibacillus populi TaxID=1827502 RepID=A0A9W5X685_9BACI|nr:D-arabinono-1,4-lactone oxidase [Lentibacillus populi]GGB50422.1 FAD-binding oxidoreductase [Lentibacillus populi]
MFSVKTNEWKNWSETVMSRSEAFRHPKTVNEIAAIVAECNATGKKIRVVGAGHSFTPLAATSEVLVSLKHLTGIDTIDREQDLVTVWAGTTLKDLGELLYKEGYAMENLGDINVQSIAGAISTGTHGTGINFGSISTQVTMLTVITASGKQMEIAADKNAEFFQASRISLGMLGVIVKVQLQVIPSHQLISETYKTPLNHCLARLDELKQANRHFEFFWFPYTKTVQIKLMNSSGTNPQPNKKGSTFNKIVIENGAFWLLSQMCRMQPRLSKTASNISALGIPSAKEAGNSHALYATPRLVKFYEMEYSVPAERMRVVLEDIQYVLENQKFAVHFPIECRYVKGDDIWLSPAYQRDSAYIAVHMYKGMEFEPYFNAMEEIFQYHGGRPHWGKMHNMTAQKLALAYPKFHDFLHVRAKLDPNGMFLNAYLQKLFAVS